MKCDSGILVLLNVSAVKRNNGRINTLTHQARDDLLPLVPERAALLVAHVGVVDRRVDLDRDILQLCAVVVRQALWTKKSVKMLADALIVILCPSLVLPSLSISLSPSVFFCFSHILSHCLRSFALPLSRSSLFSSQCEQQQFWPMSGQRANNQVISKS